MPTAKTSDDSFETDVLKADQAVLVDFWAEWCGPCKQIAPALEELSAEFAGKLKIVKLNIEDSPVTPSKLGVRGIPTLMLFKDGRVADTRVGPMPKSRIAEWLSQALA